MMLMTTMPHVNKILSSGNDDDDDTKTADKINQIKYKLIKYTELKNEEKVKEYLTHLERNSINMHVLKSTEIVACLKDLQEKTSSRVITSLVSNLIAKWKVQVKKTESKEKVIKASSSKKRNSVTTTTTKQPEIQPAADTDTMKRQKLTLSDYKIKKCQVNMNKYNEDDEENEDNGEYERYSPQPIAKSYSSSSSSSSSTSSSSNNMKMPPVPLTPLPTILSLSLQPSSTYSTMQTNNYQQQRNIINNESSSSMTDQDDALSKIFSAKHSKRIMYAGRKQNCTGVNGTYVVPKLFDLCLKSLTNSLDDLPNRLYLHNLNKASNDYDPLISKFPIQFDVLKPVLEKANARQLENIEYYNSYLLSDTEFLWKRICEQEFKKVDAPDDEDTWRELYFKKLDEREAQLKRVRSSISSKQAVKPKERQTQLATVKLVSAKPMSMASYSSSSFQSSIPNKSISTISLNKQPIRIFAESGTLKKKLQAAAPPPSIKQSQGMKDTLKLMKKRLKR